jgi:hypothetical protein
MGRLNLKRLAFNSGSIQTPGARNRSTGGQSLNSFRNSEPIYKLSILTSRIWSIFNGHASFFPAQGLENDPSH